MCLVLLNILFLKCSFQSEHCSGIIKAAKQRAKLLALRDLRWSNPDLPMVSNLDLEKLQEEGVRSSSNKPASSV